MKTWTSALRWRIAAAKAVNKKKKKWTAQNKSPAATWPCRCPLDQVLGQRIGAQRAASAILSRAWAVAIARSDTSPSGSASRQQRHGPDSKRGDGDGSLQMTALPGRRAITSVSEAQYAAEAVNWADCNPRQPSAPKQAAIRAYERLQQSTSSCPRWLAELAEEGPLETACRTRFYRPATPIYGSRMRRECGAHVSALLPARACIHLPCLALIGACTTFSRNSIITFVSATATFASSAASRAASTTSWCCFFCRCRCRCRCGGCCCCWCWWCWPCWCMVVLGRLRVRLRMRCGCAGVYAGTGAGSGPSTLGKPWVRPWSCWKPIGKSLARSRGRGQPGQDASPTQLEGMRHPASTFWAWTSGAATCPRSIVASSLSACPFGHPDFVKTQAANRLDAEVDLLRKLMQLPDVQCAWFLLAFCAAPRTQHLLHNVPPADILPYARGHDDAVWAVVEGLLGDQ